MIDERPPLALVHAPVELLGEQPRLLCHLLQLLLYPVVVLPVRRVVQVGEVAQHGKTWETTSDYYQNPESLFCLFTCTDNNKNGSSGDEEEELFARMVAPLL